jgi:hypothetical protein
LNLYGHPDSMTMALRAARKKTSLFMVNDLN